MSKKKKKNIPKKTAYAKPPKDKVVKETKEKTNPATKIKIDNKEEKDKNVGAKVHNNADLENKENLVQEFRNKTKENLNNVVTKKESRNKQLTIGLMILLIILVVIVINLDNNIDQDNDIGSNSEISNSNQNSEVEKEEDNEMQDLISGIGIIEAKPSDTETIQISGVISKVHKKIGDKVKKGTLLLELDKSTLNRTISKAKEAINQAQIEYDLCIAEEPNLEVKTNISGYINGLSVSFGTKVEQGLVLFNVCSNPKTSAEITTYIDKLVEVGDNVHLNTMTGDTIKGRVTKISDNLISTGLDKVTYNVDIDIIEVVKFLSVERVSVEVLTRFGVVHANKLSNINFAINNQVVSKISGNIKSINYSNTQYVNAGSIIIAIDSKDLDLRKTNANNQIIEANKQISNANSLIEKSKVYAQTDGIITKIVSVKDTVNVDDAVATIEEERQLEFSIELSKTKCEKVIEGQVVSITVEDYGEDRVFQGEVKEITQLEDEKYRLIIKFHEEEGLKSGMIAKANITTFK